MAYPSLRQRRRTRLRRWLFATLVVAVAVFIIALAVRYRTEERVVVDYFAVAGEVTALEEMVANDLTNLVGGVSSVDRPMMEQRLAALEEEALEALTLLEGTEAPATVAEAHGYLMVATRSWSAGVAALDDAFFEILDDPNETGGGEMLAGVLDQLRVGDAAYVGFLGAIGALDQEIVTRQFRGITFESPDDPYDVDMITLQLRATYKLGEHRDVSVTATIEPAAVGVDNNLPVVPFADTFVVTAVIANEGNLVEENIEVMLRLIPQIGQGLPITERRVVELLNPGQASTLAFDGLDPDPGGLYELVIETAVADDIEQSNDSWRLVFWRNEDS